jgi:hypothetical protein
LGYGEACAPPPKKLTCASLVMVGGAVAHPAAIPEPDVRLSPHPASQ